MIIGNLGLSTVIISLDAYSKDDSDAFKRYWDQWLTSVNVGDLSNVPAYHHLLNIAANNSLALNETSATITIKWTDLIKEEESWKSFFENAPFQISINKVSCDI